VLARLRRAGATVTVLPDLAAVCFPAPAPAPLPAAAARREVIVENTHDPGESFVVPWGSPAAIEEAVAACIAVADVTKEAEAGAVSGSSTGSGVDRPRVAVRLWDTALLALPLSRLAISADILRPESWLEAGPSHVHEAIPSGCPPHELLRGVAAAADVIVLALATPTPSPVPTPAVATAAAAPPGPSIAAWAGTLDPPPILLSRDDLHNPSQIAWPPMCHVALVTSGLDVVEDLGLLSSVIKPMSPAAAPARVTVLVPAAAVGVVQGSGLLGRLCWGHRPRRARAWVCCRRDTCPRWLQLELEVEPLAG
jgi:hypothetical protein